METSALSGHNINETFEKLIESRSDSIQIFTVSKENKCKP